MAVMSMDMEMSPSRLESNHGDIELRLMEAFSDYASESIVSSYRRVKRSSRVLGFVATTTETVLTNTGLVALVSFFVTQYKRLGRPIVQHLDEAMGRRIVSTFVRLLLVAESQQHDTCELSAAKHANFKLSFHERLQALLDGQVPRLQSLIKELEVREAEKEEMARNATPVVVMDPEDYVPKDEFIRVQDQTREAMVEKDLELVSLKDQVTTIQRTRQQLEDALSKTRAETEQEKLCRLQELAEKEQAMDSLKIQAEAAERARQQVEEDLATVRKQKEIELRRQLEEMTQKEQEMASVKDHSKAAERACQQLEEEITKVRVETQRERAMRLQAMAERELDVAALKHQVKAAEHARQLLEEEIASVRNQKEAEAKLRFEGMEEEISHMKQELMQKNYQLNKLHAAMDESMRQPRSTPSSPVSSISSNRSSTTIKVSDENQAKNGVEKGKTKNTMRRIFGAMPPSGKF